MWKKWRRRRQLSKIQPGDGSVLAPYRFYHLLTRSLFYIELPGENGPLGQGEPSEAASPDEAAGAAEGAEPPETHTYAVDVRYFADDLSSSADDWLGSTSDSIKSRRPPAAMFRDGREIYRSNLPATFPVPDGVVEVGSSSYGLSRMHYVADTGQERALTPDPRSPEGGRLRFARRFPWASRIIGWLAIVILLASLAVWIPQAIEIITHWDVLAGHVTPFNSPIRLPGAVNNTLLVAGIIAAVERALTLRNHWLIDFETMWWDL